MILLIDNYDSFTYNLVQMLEGGGAEVQVFRNDKITLGHIDEINPSCLMVSPGPGGPDQAGISVEAIRRFGPQMPVLGVWTHEQAPGFYEQMQWSEDFNLVKSVTLGFDEPFAFFDDEVPAMVNAVLDTLARHLRPQEFTAADRL